MVNGSAQGPGSHLGSLVPEPGNPTTASQAQVSNHPELRLCLVTDWKPLTAGEPRAVLCIRHQLVPAGAGAPRGPVGDQPTG